MSPEREQQTETIFQSALELDPFERGAFLDRACAGDDVMRREVESMLAVHEQAGSFLQNPAAEIIAQSIARNPSRFGPDSVIGPYKMISWLGAGGMGEVYLAHDSRLGRKVALKMLPTYLASNRDRMQRFKQEARAASGVSHPNVATIYEIGEAEGLNYIAMEYVEGKALSAKISGRPLDVSEIVNISMQIADAMDEAHSQGITHRDIKPANVMLTARGQVKVLDFGLAKVKTPEAQKIERETTVARTEPGIVMGTVDYMSPEQALGRELDHRTDIFSLGIVIYEMATGRSPFSGNSAMETIDRIIHSEPEAIAHFNHEAPAELERIILKACAKNANERYQSARDLFIDLRELGKALEVGTRLDEMATQDSSDRFDRSLQAESEGPDQEHQLRRWGHLEIRERVGSGSFSAVYRAWDGTLEREVALKLLHPRKDSAGASESSVLQEGRLLARLRHPNVVTVYGAERIDDSIGLWMEFIRGRTLEELVRAHGPFGAHEAAVIGLDLARALAAVHGAGLLHRDVKARNVMREEGGRIVLMDFGAGRESGSRDGGDLCGTPLYMAPEIFRGEEPTPRADLYSLGVLLYYLVTGAHPVEARTSKELSNMHESGKGRLLRDRRADLPETFVKVVERAMARTPDERFSSAGEMELALGSALGVKDSTRTVSSPVSRSKLLLLAAAGLLVAMLVLAWNIWMRSVAPLGTESAPSQPPAPPVAEAYTVEAALFREVRGRTERLSPGNRVGPGDKLFLEFRASEALHVYVLSKDEKGESYLLFPLPGYDLTNPLSSGRTHRLPGSREGRNFSWQVTSAGGREYFLIVASRKHLPELETELAALARPQVERPIVAWRLSDEAIHRLRGIGGLVEGPAPSGDPTPGDVFERARRLAEKSEEGRDVWARQIDLLNPPM